MPDQITSLDQLDNIIANQEGDTLYLPSDFSGEITSLDQLDNLIENKTVQQDFANPKRFSFIDILKSPARGLASSAEMYARNLRVLAKSSGVGVDEATSLVELAKKLRISDDPDADFLTRSVSGGIESSIQSLSAGAPGAIIGAIKGGAAGSAVPVAGTGAGALAGGILGFAASAGVLFSVAEYDRFMEELRDTLLKNGATEDEIKAAESEFFDEAIISAISEGGFEAASDLVQGKILLMVGGTGLREALKQPFKNWAKKFVQSYFVEAGSELATTAVQVETREAAGISTPSFSDQFMDVLGTTAVQSLMFSGGGAYSNKKQVENQVKKADEIFTKHKQTIDDLYEGKDVTITPEMEDDILNAYLVINAAGVKRSEVIKSGINKYANEEITKLTKDIDDTRKKILSNDVEDIDLANTDLTEKITRLKKLSAVLSDSDYGLLQNALANISSGLFDKEITEIEEQIGTELDDPFVSDEEAQREIAAQQEELAREAIVDQQKDLESEITQEELSAAGMLDQEFSPEEIYGAEYASDEEAAKTLEAEILKEYEQQIANEIQSEFTNDVQIDETPILKEIQKDFIESSKESTSENIPLKNKSITENKVITEDTKNQAIERIKQRNKGRLSANIDPNDLKDALIVAGYYAEKGIRKSADIINNLAKDIGEWVREHSKEIIDALKSSGKYQIQTEEKDKSIPVVKIISGGQTGADEAGLLAAERLGIETGGTAPSNYFTEKGSNLQLRDRYKLKASGNYQTRTVQNIKDSDGTVVFGDQNSAGSKLTISQAKKFNKPVIVNPNAEQLRKWTIDNNIKVLNVAGNRASKNKNVFNQTGTTIVDAFKSQKVEKQNTINVYWGNPESKTNTRILSNLAPRKFKYESIDGITREYGSVEHAYQSNKNGKFNQKIYDAYVSKGGYGVKISTKLTDVGKRGNLQIMKDLVVESFVQNPNSNAAKKLLEYENFTHNTNELIDKAFLEGLSLARNQLLRKQKPNRLTKQQYYTGNIVPEKNTVFVFGSNPEGRHGAGAAKVAVQKFGAKYGQGEGLQGNSYALPTKDIRVKVNNGFKSISPEKIINSIKKLYNVANQNSDKQFKIAYRNTSEKSLNGYTGFEMMKMFQSAGDIPSNIIFSKEWFDAGVLNVKKELNVSGSNRLTKQQSLDIFNNPGNDVLSDIQSDLNVSVSEFNDTQLDVNENDETYINRNETEDQYDYRVDQNSVIDNAMKLANYISEVSGQEFSIEEIVNDSRKLDLKAFESKYNKYANKSPVKGWNLKKVYAFSKDYYRRKNRVLFKFTNDRNGNLDLQLLGNEKITKLPEMPSEWEHMSVFDRIALNRGWKYLWSVGSFMSNNKGEITSKMSDYKLSLKSKSNPVTDRMNAMWNAGQYILLMRSAQGKSEVWIKNLYPEITDRQKAREATVKSVYQEIGMSKNGKIVTDANALKRSQIVMNTGPYVRYSKVKGRKAKARVISENTFGYYDPKTKSVKRFNNRDEAVKDSISNGLRESNVKSKHDGAIYVTRDYLNTYLSELGLETKNKGGVKTFIWQKTPDGTVAGKGYFFVAAPGSFEEQQLKKHGVDILLYEDASKLGYPLDKNIDISDGAIVFTLEEPVLHKKQTFTRSQLPMMPVSLQNNYNQMLSKFVNSISSVTRRFLSNDKGGINEFMKRALGFVRSESQNDFKRMLNSGAQLHPAILGATGVNNPLKQSYINFIRDKVLRMPRNGFHAGFRPSESDLNKGEIKISRQAFELLKEHGFKIGDKLMITRSPAVRADNVIIAKAVGVHDLGNVIEMNDVEYAVFSTGDFDGDHGAVIIPEQFEIDFFEATQGIVGDITLDQYKEGVEKKNESVLDEQDMAEMVVRNAAGKDLIGSIANIYNIYHIFVHNNISMNFVESNLSIDFIEMSKINKMYNANFASGGGRLVRFIPKGLNRNDYLDFHEVISHYHLAATDQAKEDALFTISEKRTGTNRDNIENKNEQVPLSSLLMELFDVYVQGEGLVSDYNSKRKYIYAIYTGKNNPFNLLRGLLNSFGDNPNTGNSWVYEDFINNINEYIDVAKNSGLGNTQVEKLLMNIPNNGFDFGFAEVEGSPENKRMLESHIETMKELSKIYNEKTVKDFGKVKSIAIKAIAKWNQKGKSYTEASQEANELINNSGLDEKQKDSIGMLVFDRTSYEALAKLKVSIVTKNFLENYFKIYNKIHGNKYDSVKNLSFEERTGKEQLVLPETYKYKDCYKNG